LIADASLFVFDTSLDLYQAATKPMISHINVGYGEDLSIRELAELVADVTGFNRQIVFDESRPDGTMRKLMDSGRLRTMGWQPKISLRDGVRDTYDWYLANLGSAR
jgi:nucleoside-diphosphate-sugar epimerase